MEEAKLLEHLLYPDPRLEARGNNAWVPYEVPGSPPGEGASRTLDPQGCRVRGTITRVLRERGKLRIPILTKGLLNSEPQAQGRENNA